MVDFEAVGQKRTGAGTRLEVQRVAFELFTEQGYESTSLRQIAAAVGINKASLYYHFANKEAILGSLFEQRGSEADDLADWVGRQDPRETLLEEAILRWVDSFAQEKLRGIRFLRSNPLIARRFETSEGGGIRDSLHRLSSLLAKCLPEVTATNMVLLRMAILSINAAVEAAAGMDIPDDAIVAAARTAARVLIKQIQP